MTDAELRTVARVLAPVIREAIAAGVKEYVARVEALETKEFPVARDGAPGPQGEKGLDGTAGERGPAGPEGAPGRDGRDGLPGVPGLPGEKGIDGLNGKDGEPGLAGKDGTAGLTYHGVYQEGKTYEPGELVTWAGSMWHCNEDTASKPGDGSKAWTLTVKKGRDGRDGKDGERGPQGAAGKDWQQMVTR